jgi:transposase
VKVDLSLHTFTTVEKLWFAEQLNKLGVAPGSLAHMFDVNHKTKTAWARKHREGMILRPSNGRPVAISEAVKQRVLQSLEDDVYKVQKKRVFCGGPRINK